MYCPIINTLQSTPCSCRVTLEVFTGCIFQSEKKKLKFWPGARPNPKEKLKFRPEPSPAQLFFYSDFIPDRLGLRGFKTGPISCLHAINVFFADDLFFCCLSKQPIRIDCFPLYFETGQYFIQN